MSVTNHDANFQRLGKSFYPDSEEATKKTREQVLEYILDKYEMYMIDERLIRKIANELGCSPDLS